MTSFTCCWFCLECTLTNLHTAGSFTSFKSQPRCHLREAFPNPLPRIDPSSITGHSLTHDPILFSSQPLPMSEMILFLFFFFLFKFLFIYLFIYWLHWVFVATHGLSLVAASGGYSSLRCMGFSLQWLLLLQSMGSRHTGFSSCGTRASVVVARGL